VFYSIANALPATRHEIASHVHDIVPTEHIPEFRIAHVPYGIPGLFAEFSKDNLAFVSQPEVGHERVQRVQLAWVRSCPFVERENCFPFR
jgi:hypothetical protein